MMNFLQDLPNAYKLKDDSVEEVEVQQPEVVETKPVELIKTKTLEAKIKALELEKENLVKALKDANARYMKLRDEVENSKQVDKHTTRKGSLEDLLKLARQSAQASSSKDIYQQLMASRGNRRF